MDGSCFARFELKRPGYFVSGESPEWEDGATHLLWHMEREFKLAIVSFCMFEEIEREKKQKDLISSPLSELKQIYARSFVVCLDSTNKILKALKKDFNPPGDISPLIKAYDRAFGHLKHMRDSIAHIEDRGRLRDKKKKPIKSGVVCFGNFIEKGYVIIGADGTNYQIEISETVLESVQSILQKVLDAYEYVTIPHPHVP